jgi:hypothetical protein
MCDNDVRDFVRGLNYFEHGAGSWYDSVDYLNLLFYRQLAEGLKEVVLGVGMGRMVGGPGVGEGF